MSAGWYRQGEENTQMELNFQFKKANALPFARLEGCLYAWFDGFSF